VGIFKNMKDRQAQQGGTLRDQFGPAGNAPTAQQAFPPQMMPPQGARMAPVQPNPQMTPPMQQGARRLPQPMPNPVQQTSGARMTTNPVYPQGGWRGNVNPNRMQRR